MKLKNTHDINRLGTLWFCMFLSMFFVAQSGRQQCTLIYVGYNNQTTSHGESLKIEHLLGTIKQQKHAKEHSMTIGCHIE